jgi:hypothetical protein
MRLFLLTAVLTARLFGQDNDVVSIVRHSAEVNNRDFQAESQFNYQQTEKLRTGSRTSLVMMIDGSPYQRLVAIDGVPLNAQQTAFEQQKQAEAVRQRKAQSPAARRARISKFQRGQARDNELISQLWKAFDFKLEGEAKLNGFDVWVLKATPKSGYHPPTMQAQVLPGMQGEMWIDKKTYEWVKVIARVVRPVSIDGFLAQVQPGTEFEIEKNPVAGDMWQVTHFSSRAKAKILHIISHNEQDDVTFSNFEPVSSH